MKESPKIPSYKFKASKADKAEIGFEIFTLNSLFSRYDKLKSQLEKPHRVEFYLILFITKGTGRHFIDFQQYKYHKGNILFISKGQVHAFEVLPESDGFLILFTEVFLSKNLIHSDILSLYRIYNYHLHLPILQPEETGDNDFIGIINAMHEEYNSSNTFAKEEILRLLLKLLLLRAERVKHTLIPQGKSSESFVKFGAFRNLLENHFTRTRNAKEYAGMMNISYKYLNEICKSVTGSTAKKFIDNFVILEIKRRLATSDLSVKELTYELGFDEPTNLLKYFKKHTLQTPSQFKELIIKSLIGSTFTILL